MTGATREVFWNVSASWLMYALLVPTLVVAGYGLWRKVRLWRCGQPAVRLDRPLARLGLVLQHGLLQLRLARQAYAGTFHVLVFAGFIVLFLATLVVMVDKDGTSLMRGGFYLWFQSLMVDLFGGLVIVGVVLAGVRRWARRPRQLIYSAEATGLLVLILAIVITGFLVEGWRIAATDDPWGRWSPIGNLVASASESLLPASALRPAHASAWWLHVALVYGFIAWAPYTKLAHVVTGPLSIFTGNLDGYARSRAPVDFESDAPLGVGSLERFSWRDLLDLDACTECGRCTAACPPNTVGKALSPRDVVLDLRRLMHARSPELLATRGQSASSDGPRIPVIDPGTATASEALWQCTTCAACLEACPVYVEPLGKIVEMRRFLAMEEADYPQTMAAAITSLEQRGHPYPGARFSRVDWAQGLDVPVLGETKDSASIDVLLWVGCANALLERNHAIVRAVATLLRDAGVRFAILGREERCTGDPARRMGNEFLFKQMATRNMQLFAKYGVRRILTSCPHCYNSFANDYQEFGGRYEVEHHSTFLARLVAEGKLNPDPAAARRVTYHDPCYLARYNGIVQEPRGLVRRAAGAKPAEMAASGRAGFCCGGGGGMSFAEEVPAQRVNRERARQAAATGAEVVAVACPFCMTMMEDGIGAVAGDREITVRDVAELLRAAVPSETSSKEKPWT